MKTARQSGWYLSVTDNLVSGYDSYGNYFEAFRNELNTITFALYDGNDLPQSVLDLVALWLGVSLPIPFHVQL